MIMDTRFFRPVPHALISDRVADALSMLQEIPKETFILPVWQPGFRRWASRDGIVSQVTDEKDMLHNVAQPAIMAGCAT